MDLEDYDERSIILAETPTTVLSINTTMENILSNMMELDIADLISEDVVVNLPMKEDNTQETQFLIKYGEILYFTVK